MERVFNPDWTKQAQEIIFSKNATTHPPLFFNNSEIKLSPHQKHLGLTIDSKLSFNEHINDKIHQANKGVALIWKLLTFLPHNNVLTIYKLFIRPDDADDDEELFLWYGWPMKGIWPYFQPGPLSEILTIANLRHATSRIWTCAEPEFRLCWVQVVCSNDNY